MLVTYTLILCVANRQIPASISQAVYGLPVLGAGLWIIIVAAVTFLTMPTLLDLCSENTRFLAFFACVGLMMVAVCPLDKQSHDTSYRMHMAGAYICGICSQIVVSFNYPWLLFCWLPWAAAFVWITKQGKWRTMKFWAEVTCIVTTYLFILMQ